jgi:tRNA pseudouridine55 synthase
LNSGKPKKQPLPVASFPEFSNRNRPIVGYNYADGAVFLIDKPEKWSSFRVVGLLRKCTGIKKIGHAGTLDPLATGLLLICTGKATKSISLIQGQDKVYEAEIQFGAATNTFDREGEITEESSFAHITESLIREKLENDFTGEISQLPPMFSALQIRGERLYKLARKGITVEREARKVTIHHSGLIHYDTETGKAVVHIKCSKGTYIRTIADDLGKMLGTHAHLNALRRTQTGNYRVDDALEVNQLLIDFKLHGKIDLS